MPQAPLPSLVRMHCLDICRRNEEQKRILALDTEVGLLVERKGRYFF